VPITTTFINPLRLLGCSGDALAWTVPTQKISSAPQGELTTVEMKTNFTQVRPSPTIALNQWTVNCVAYHANYSRSLLASAQKGETISLDDELGLYDFGSNGTVRLVIYHYNQFTYHPMHLHGYNFQVLAEGFGAWNGTITIPDNPMRRDVHVLDKAQWDRPTNIVTPSFIVIQFFTDSPGVWPFHCHLVWHNSAGFFVNFLIRPKDVQKLEIPGSIEDTCTTWNSYYAANHPEQLDAGI